LKAELKKNDSVKAKIKAEAEARKAKRVIKPSARSLVVKAKRAQA
jgi:hypothetical protein